MGFMKNWDVGSISDQLHRLYIEASSTYNDGYTASACKYELYQLKCLIEDMYKRLPVFDGEEQWEKERVVELLKRK